MQKKLQISKPFTAMKYDFIVDNGVSLARVQVKSCHRWKAAKENDVWAANFYHVRNGERKSYSTNEIEFAAFFLVEIEAWYIIPISEVGEKRSLTFYPNSGKGKWEAFRERWGLLTTYGP